MAWFTDDPGEATANGFLAGCVGGWAVVICAVCEVCGGCCCCGVVCGCAICASGLACATWGAGLGAAGAPGRRASIHLRMVSLSGAGARICARRFWSESTSVLGGLMGLTSGPKTNWASDLVLMGTTEALLGRKRGAKTSARMITACTTSEIHAASRRR